MKAKFFPIMALLPLLVVLILALVGITMNSWVYMILGIVCPLVAGTLWLIHKDTERKVKDARRDLRNK